MSNILNLAKSYWGLLAARSFLKVWLLDRVVENLSTLHHTHGLILRQQTLDCAAPRSVAFAGMLAAGLAEMNSMGTADDPIPSQMREL